MQSGQISHGFRGGAVLEKNQNNPVLSLFKRRCFLFAGFFFVAIGLLGIVLPILDTTPFMLLGAYCFARSSKKWHRWLLSHPIFGEYITAFRQKRGLTIKQKYRIAITMSIMMSITGLHGLLLSAPVMLWVALIVWVICMLVLYFSRTAELIDLKGSSDPVGGVT